MGGLIGRSATDRSASQSIGNTTKGNCTSTVHLWLVCFLPLRPLKARTFPYRRRCPSQPGTTSRPRNPLVLTCVSRSKRVPRHLSRAAASCLVTMGCLHSPSIRWTCRHTPRNCFAPTTRNLKTYRIGDQGADQPRDKQYIQRNSRITIVTTNKRSEITRRFLT